jgi:uncharacterized protein YjbJ (UPF0337 family)
MFVIIKVAGELISVGVANELAGQARQGVGKAIDDKEMQVKGIAQKAEGDVT